MRVLSSFAALAAALVVSATAWAARYPQYFPRVTEIASDVAGRPVDVYCEVQEDCAALEPRTCGYLLLLIQDPNERSGLHGKEGYYGEARGLLSLLHEANHLRGLRSESAAECRALASVPAYARALGADRRHVAKLVRLARRVHGLLSPEYQIGC